MLTAGKKMVITIRLYNILDYVLRGRQNTSQINLRNRFLLRAHNSAKTFPNKGGDSNAKRHAHRPGREMFGQIPLQSHIPSVTLSL